MFFGRSLVIYVTCVIQSSLFDYCYITFQLGIAIVNDFKSIEGDRELGLQVSLLSVTC